MDNRARLVPPVGGKRCASARCDAYGSLLAARYTIGRALGDLVAEGYFDAATSDSAARSILSRDLMSFVEYSAFGSGERCASSVSGLGGALRARPLSGLGGALRARPLSGLGGALRAPPGASRCSARASLPTPRGEPRFGVDCTPSRPHPPHEGASPALYLPTFRYARGEASRPCGVLGLCSRHFGPRGFGLPTRTVKGAPSADSTSRGVAAGRSCAARHERSKRLAAGGAAPPTRM